MDLQKFRSVGIFVYLIITILLASVVKRKLEWELKRSSDLNV
jgi:regulatory protein YycI of two-component signal transduction system YycFG